MCIIHANFKVHVTEEVKFLAGSPVKPSVTLNSTIIEHQAATLICNYNAVWNETRLWYRWTRSDGQTKQESTNNLLVIDKSDVTRDNKMMYYCTVRNVADLKQSDPYSLDVHCKYYC